MARSIDTIDAILTGLITRVNQLDGVNLSSSDRSTVAQLVAEISGLRTTVNQAVLGMEADRQAIREDLDALTLLVQSHLDVLRFSAAANVAISSADTPRC